ncbi:hypothetical protein BS50DRAFT_539354 [Corynespora cassiicola Philippines]|uniref:Uncharacterized protein n=1 Tax=Corynespora cassiicola Philippines TaxID=1448308 RepID=A0A2T2P9J5_CORCC|nr:hypothetical protein BS50DRAFT_539354 [Corynespora cassiicola Philippines]
MGIIFSTARTILNSLLPFTNASTPLVQDLVHTAILAISLYYAPQITEYYNTNRTQNAIPDEIQDPQDDFAAATEDIPLAEDLVLQDTDNEDLEPPPLAPTPPPGFQQHHEPPPENPIWREANAEQMPFDEPGPAERPRPTPANRVVGTKKAKSLARKDQRRAYHEFHRQEAEMRRLREAEGKDEREAAAAAEKARRAEVEREIAEREREARERKKEEERKELEREQQKRERAVAKARAELENTGAVNLVDIAIEEDKDRVWIERLVRASGILSQLSKNGAHIIITGEGWLVRVDAELMRDAYAAAVSFGQVNGGNVDFADFGGILEDAVKARAIIS